MSTDLLTQDTVHFLKIVDDVALLLVEPAGERDDDEFGDATAMAYR